MLLAVQFNYRSKVVTSIVHCTSFCSSSRVCLCLCLCMPVCVIHCVYTFSHWPLCWCVRIILTVYSIFICMCVCACLLACPLVCICCARAVARFRVVDLILVFCQSCRCRCFRLWYSLYVCMHSCICVCMTVCVVCFKVMAIIYQVTYNASSKALATVPHFCVISNSIL